MKKILFTSFVLMTLGGYAQIIHDDLNPDFMLDIPEESNGSDFFDFDQDGNDDAILAFYNYASFGYWNLGIDQMDVSDPKIEFLYDVSKPANAGGSFYVKGLTLNEDISHSADFSGDYPQVGDSYDANLLGNTDFYIGFRLITPTEDYKYGWILVDFTDAPKKFVIKELAFQDTENTAIKAGETGSVGIISKKREELNLSAYPNPSSGAFQVDCSSCAFPVSTEVYDIIGKKLDVNFRQEGMKINFEITQGHGNYILLIRDANGLSKTSQLIVE